MRGRCVRRHNTRSALQGKFIPPTYTPTDPQEPRSGGRWRREPVKAGAAEIARSSPESRRPMLQAPQHRATGATRGS